jgi:hypothetical protein
MQGKTLILLKLNHLVKKYVKRIRHTNHKLILICKMKKKKLINFVAQMNCLTALFILILWPFGL